jgi:biopolymer transport protein ExbD
MGILVGMRRGVVSGPNIVPLIDILLVLLVIFMLFPRSSWGLRAQTPQDCDTEHRNDCVGGDKDGIVVVQVLADGSLRVNQEPVNWENVESLLTEVFKVRANRTAFIRGDASVEFSVVVRVIDVMNTAGIAPVGLLTQQLGNGL